MSMTVIREVAPRSPAGRAGVRVGETLTHINGHPIVDVLDYPGNSVYVVQGDHEYMIPAVKQFILSTDMDTNRMEVKLIEGMRSDEN